MNKKIYVVTSGSYSDYHIDGVFDNKELAQAFIDSFNFDDTWGKMEIEEWDLNGGEYRKGLKLYYIEFQPYSSDVKFINNSVSPSREIGIYYVAYNGCDFVYVWGKDEKHAIKIANEKRAMYLANNPQ